VRQQPRLRAILPQAAGVTQAQASHVPDWPENGTLIPDEGWRVDQEAVWMNDAIFLPEDVTQDAEGVVRGKGEPLPVNAPTGDWGVLRGNAAADSIPVVLPRTVEEHFWVKFGSRPYTPEEYRYAADDPVPMNGAYLGVSWWYRTIAIPASTRDKRIFLHIRGAHFAPRFT
jgi:beta-galactosidase